MGWLGWVPEVALATDVNLVIMALESRTELLSDIFGNGKKPKGPVTAKGFKAFVHSHNSRLRGRKDGK